MSSVGFAFIAFLFIQSMQAHAQERGGVPQFQVDASWPKPLPNRWILGQVSGIATDRYDRIWVVHRPGSLTPRERAAERTPPSTRTTSSGSPAVAVDTAAREVFAADGYANRRVVVFDSETGAYKRHWGAYGRKPVDEKLPPYDPARPPSPQSATRCTASASRTKAWSSMCSRRRRAAPAGSTTSCSLPSASSDSST